MRRRHHQSRGTWRRAFMGMAAATALLGAGLVGTAPDADAAPEVADLSSEAFPTDSDPAIHSVPRWQNELYLANGDRFVSYWTSRPFIMGAIFNHGELVYCLEPGDLIAPPGDTSTTRKDRDYLKNFSTQGGTYLSDALGGDGEALYRLLGTVLEEGYSTRTTRDEMMTWQWDHPENGTKLAKWTATQLLVWETTTGERDQDFNLRPEVADENHVANMVFQRLNGSAAQHYSNMIRAEYDAIVEAVKSDLMLPAFLDADSIELEWDQDDRRFVSTQTDPLVSQTTFTPELPLRAEVDGDTVTFSVDQDDLVGQPYGALTFSVTASRAHSAAGVVVWGSPVGQDVGWSDTVESTVPASATVSLRVPSGGATFNKVLGDHVDDSVTGAGIDYPGSANWFEYTPVQNLSTNPVQTFDLIAGRDRLKVGTMTVTNNFDRTITVSYSLKQGLEGLTNDGTAHLALLNEVDELTTVAPGQQPYTMRGEQSITLSLDGLTRTVTETTGKGKDKVTREVVRQVTPAIDDIDDFIVYLHTNARGVINTGHADYDTPFYVKVTGPSYPDGRVFEFSVNTPSQIHLAPGQYRIVEVATAQGDPLDGYWETSYSVRKVTVVAYDFDNVSATITNKHDDDA